MRAPAVPSLACLALTAVAACGGGGDFVVASDFTGTYDVAITNKQNGCAFEKWNVDETSRGIPIVVAQDAAAGLTGEVQGGAGVLLGLWLGTNRFTAGTVSGDLGTLTIHGTNVQKKLGCSYTLTAEASFRLTGNTIEGTMTYTAVTNKSPDCGALEGCKTVQALAGSRPPK